VFHLKEDEPKLYVPFVLGKRCPEVSQYALTILEVLIAKFDAEYVPTAP
jgi:hypothetical protein